MTDIGAGPAFDGGPAEALDKPIDFDAWARLSARLAKRGEGERAEILAAEGIDPGKYRDADAHWRKILDADLAAGRTRRAERYGEACADELQRRRTLATPATIVDPPSPPAPAPAPDAPQAKVEVEVPSFLRDDLARPPVAPMISIPLSPSTMGPEATIPAPSSGLLWSPAPESSRPAPGGTLDVSALFGGPAVPFVERGSAPPPPPEAPRPAPARPPTAGGTADVSGVFGGSAVPFMDRGSAPPPPPEAPRPAPVRPPTAGGTADVSGFFGGPAVPFPVAPPASRRPPEVSPASRGPSTMGPLFTIPAPNPGLLRSPAPTATAAWNAPVHPQTNRVASVHDEVSIGGFTMHQYASLCAELAVHAHQTGAVLARYGLAGEEARRHLASLWEQQLIAHPDLCHAWTDLSAQYRDWLLHQRG